MTDALAKWTAALVTFDGIKHHFQASGQVEKALNSIALQERVLLFRGSDSDIVERLSAYDMPQGKLRLVQQCLSLYVNRLPEIKLTTASLCHQSIYATHSMLRPGLEPCMTAYSWLCTCLPLTHLLCAMCFMHVQ